MSISFNQVPDNLRVPMLAAEFDNSNAISGPQNQPYRHVLIGPKLAGGTKATGTKHLVTSKEQAIEYFGAGSLISEMAAGFLENNRINELHCIGLDDAGAGVAATGALTLTGAPTAAGTLKLYIAGRVVQIAVSAGDDLADIASGLKDLMDADTRLLVSAAIDGVDDQKLNFTAKNKGTAGNLIDLRVVYYSDDAIPAGVTATITAMANGATNPDVESALDAIDDKQYILMTCAFDDQANIVKMQNFLLDRFGPLKQNDGYCFYGKTGTHSELVTVGDDYNSQFTYFLGFPKRPTHPAVDASRIMGTISTPAANDPARPFQTLEVIGIMPEIETDSFTLEERNILLYHGISTTVPLDNGNVAIERIISTYKTNNAGADDESYLNLNTLLTLSYIRYDWRNYMLRKYPRHKLANDGEQFAQGQPIMTPKLGRAEAIAKYEEWQSAGLVEGLEAFKAALIVERNASNKDRLDWMLPPDLINQLRVMGTKISFLL